jgi:hypothetical protein
MYGLQIYYQWVSISYHSLDTFLRLIMKWKGIQAYLKADGEVHMYVCVCVEGGEKELLTILKILQNILRITKPKCNP